MTQETMMASGRRDVGAAGLALAAGGVTAAELVHAIAARANLPALHAAVGAAPAGERAESLAVVASAMRAVAATLDDLAARTSGIAATIALPDAES